MSDGKDVEKDEFLSLSKLLLEHKWRVGTIATAIELHGVSGLDRFGRFKLFKKNSEDAMKALNLLAREFAFDVDRMPSERSPAEEDDGFGNFHNYGWYKNTAPNFAKIETSDVAKTPLELLTKNKKGENADLLLIGALMMFIKGELGNTKHPDSISPKKLLYLLDKKIENAPGLSDSSLSHKMPFSVRLLKQYLKQSTANSS